MASTGERTREWLPLAATFAIGAAFTMTAFGVAYDLDGQKVRRQFDRDASERVVAIRRTLDAGLHELESIAALFGSSERVTRTEFASFARRLIEVGDYIQALEWAPRVEARERRAFEETVRGEGYPDFEIVEYDGGMRRATERDVYYPVLFLEPFAGNEPALGFDLASTPERREAIERARATGVESASAPIELVQGPSGSSGFVVVAPVTNEPGAPRAGGPAERGDAGIALAVFRSAPMVESSLTGLNPAGIDVELADVTAGSAPVSFFRLRSGSDEKDSTGEPERVHEFEFAGRRWRATCRATAAYRAGRRSFEPWLVLVAGIVLSSVVTAYVAVRRRSEERFRAMNLKLARTNFDLNRLRQELEETLQREKAASRLKTQFVSMASHEFRTPLSGILAASQALERYGDRMTPEQRRSRFEAIEAEIGHMTRMLESVMLLGRADLGRLEFRPQPVDVPRLCEEAVADAARDDASGPRVELEVSGFTGPVDLDRTLLRHIVSNLLSNAVKYSRAGAVIRFAAERSGDEVCFRVHDEGIGIPEEDRERIFESFQRGANVGSAPGSGLGLAVVRRAVEAHGGSVTFESAVDRGSTFVVRLRAPASSERRAGHGA